jgi:hypothetical protein
MANLSWQGAYIVWISPATILRLLGSPTKIAMMTVQINASPITVLFDLVGIRYNEYIYYCLYDSGMIPDAVLSDGDFHFHQKVSRGNAGVGEVASGYQVCFEVREHPAGYSRPFDENCTTNYCNGGSCEEVA